MTAPFRTPPVLMAVAEPTPDWCPTGTISALLAISDADLDDIEQVTRVLVEAGYRPSQVTPWLDEIIRMARASRESVSLPAGIGGLLGCFTLFTAAIWAVGYSSLWERMA
jgi:hypothetical protein